MSLEAGPRVWPQVVEALASQRAYGDKTILRSVAYHDPARGPACFGRGQTCAVKTTLLNMLDSEKSSLTAVGDQGRAQPRRLRCLIRRRAQLGRGYEPYGTDLTATLKMRVFGQGDQNSGARAAEDHVVAISKEFLPLTRGKQRAPRAGLCRGVKGAVTGWTKLMARFQQHALCR